MRFLSTAFAAAGFLCAFTSLLPLAQASHLAEPSVSTRGSSVAIDRATHAAYIADTDNQALHRVDLISGEIVSTPLACAPEQVLLLPGARIAVSLRGCGRIDILSLNPLGEGEVVASTGVAAEPYGLAFSPIRNELFVTSAYGHALTVLDPDTLAIQKTLDLPREPRGLSVSADGKKLFVTHTVGAQLSVVDLMPPGSEEPALRRVQALTGSYRNQVDRALAVATLHPTASLAHTAVLNEEGTRLFIPHLLVQNGSETTRFISGGYGGVSVQEDTSFSTVAVINTKNDENIGASLKAEPKPSPKDKSAAAPPIQNHRSIAINPGLFGSAPTAPAGSPSRQVRAAAVLGDFLYVASFGTGELIELDARSLDPAMSIRRSFSVGEGPTGVDVDPQTQIAVVWSQHSHTLTLVNLGSGETEPFQVAEDPLPGHISRGRALFVTEKDLRISRDGRACSSCHPDGRDDGLVWRLGDGPRRTLMLSGRVAHGPYGWNGIHAKLEDNIRETIRRLGGQGLPERDLRDLASYVREGLSLPPETHPHAQDELEPMAKRGHDIFVSEQAGCNTCHPLGQDSSDRKRHNVASAGKGETQHDFRTPPLRFLAGAGSYFHDGRYTNLEQVVDDNLDRMGQTSHLNPHDRAALIAFLRTL